MISKEQGEEKASDASDEIIYKVDVPANRSVLQLHLAYIVIPGCTSELGFHLPLSIRYVHTTTEIHLSLMQRMAMMFFSRVCTLLLFVLCSSKMITDIF